MFNTDDLKGLQFGERFVRRNPLLYPAARQVLEYLESADCAARREWTLSRLQTVLAAAHRTPYGLCVPGGPDPESWPVLEKTTVRDYPEGFVARRSWPAAKARTSGTTGTPLRLLRSANAIAFEQACIDWVFERLGADPLASRIAVLRNDAVVPMGQTQPPYWKSALGGRKLILSSNHLSRRTSGEYIAALSEFQPEVLYATPTSLENLCSLLARKERRLRIPYVVLSSEVLHPESWQLAHEVFDCNIADYYGQAERLAFAYAFEAGAYRFLPGYAYVELLPLDDSEADILDGTRLYEVVGTSLWNLAMPLVRYRTGDFVRLPADATARELEEWTYGIKPFPGVIGRDQDVLIKPDGTRHTGIGVIARDVANIVRVQFIQESYDTVRIRVLPRPGYSATDAEKLRENARRRLPGFDVLVETAAELEKTPRGKTPFVVHRPLVRAALQGMLTRQRARGGADA